MRNATTTKLHHIGQCAAAMALTLLAVSAEAKKAVSYLTVDAVQNCYSMEVAQSSVGAELWLESGTYVARVVSSTADNCSGNGCVGSSVTFGVHSSPNPDMTSYAVRLVPTSTYVKFTLAGGQVLRAFTLDTYCGDNIGSTVLSFTKQ